MAKSPFFLLMVEIPSMAVITVHKAIATATGRPPTALNIWAYRAIGVVSLVVLVVAATSFGSAAVTVAVLAVVGLVVFCGVRARAQDRRRMADVPSFPPLSPEERQARIAWRQFWSEQPLAQSVPVDVGVATRTFSRCCAKVQCVCGRDQWVSLDEVKMLVPPVMPQGWRPGDPVPPGLTYRAVDRPPNSNTYEASQLFGKPRGETGSG